LGFVEAIRVVKCKSVQDNNNTMLVPFKLPTTIVEFILELNSHSTALSVVCFSIDVLSIMPLLTISELHDPQLCRY
jgi:hypothetical protein